MAEKVIIELITNVHGLPTSVGSGVYKEIAKSAGVKFATIPEGTVKWSVNNLLTSTLSEIAIKKGNEKHDLATTANKSLGFLESILLPYTVENQRELMQRVVAFIGCMKTVIEMDAENKPMTDIEKVVTDFVNA